MNTRNRPQGMPATAAYISQTDVLNANLAETAGSPRQAAAAATAAATTAPAAATAAPTAATTATAATAAAAALRQSLAQPGSAGGFLVKYIEARQAYVRDFFLGQGDLRRQRRVRRCLYSLSNGCRGCTARQRQRCADDSQHGHCFRMASSLRRLLCAGHVSSPMPGYGCGSIPIQPNPTRFE